MGDSSSYPLGAFGPALGISPDAVAAQALSRQIQSGAQKLQGDISHDSQDPPYIQAMEHFEGLSHEEIFFNVDEIDLRAMAALGEKWVNISNGLSGAVAGASVMALRALSDGFSGEFAAAGETARRQFFDQAQDLYETIAVVGHRIRAVAAGAEVVKKSVPPPPGRTPSASSPTAAVSTTTPLGLADMLGAVAPSDAAAAERQKEELRQVAIGVMNTVYKPTYEPAGTGVPTFVPVRAPDDGPTGTAPSSNGPSPTGPASTVPGASPSGAPDNGTRPGQPDQPTDRQTGTEGPQTTAANAEQTTSAAQNPTTQQTTTSNLGTPPGDTTRSTTGVPTVTGTPSRPGAPGRSALPGVPGVSQSPGPGRSVSGTPGPPGAGNPAAAAAARAGRPMTGMPGMMSPGGARRGDDESERKTPDYLIADRQEELLGPAQRMVPPTIGDDAPATHDEGGGYR